MLKQTKVMIVDDDQVLCDVIRDELREQGYVCDAALNGSDSLVKLVTKDFNVVLLDIRLPDISGIEVLSKIRSNFPNTAVIMITAVSDVDTAVQAMKLGALDYIVKPFDLDRVNASIRTVFENKRCLAESRYCETPLSAGGEEEDKQALRKSFNEMDAIARGVEVKQDLLTRHSKIVTEETIEIARWFGIPEKEICGWVAERARLDAEKSGVISSSLHKLQQSPLAQAIMGVAVPYLYTTKPNES